VTADASGVSASHPHADTRLEVRGAQVRYRRGGDGTPLLYLHGEAEPLGWQPLHAALARHFDVIVPDHLGFGGSDRPEWLEGMDDLVLHYVDVLDTLELDRVHLMGSSFGGWLAAEVAVLCPHRVDGLILVAALGLHVDGAPVRDTFMLTPEEHARLSVYDPALADRLLAPAADEVAARRQLEERLKGQATLALLAWQPLLHDPKLARRLNRIRARTLVVWGDDDRLVPGDHGRAYAEGIPGAKLEIVADCGHLPQYERPETVVTQVRAFLQPEPRLGLQ
jgi:pimeloyl-ACP methyl ester carboxylesterase